MSMPTPPFADRLKAEPAGPGGSAGPADAVPSTERDMTVLFTDIANFTGTCARFGAARAADFLNRHFAMLAGCVEVEGGTIDKFMGDALMAFWGAPAEQPDHAARACRAACAIARAVDKDNRLRRAAGEAPVRLRVGIHSGPMMVGHIGVPARMSYTIVGEAVNTGQRIEALGKRLGDPHAAVTILVSGDTAARLGGSMPLEPLGEHALRGRQAPIRVHRLRAS